MLVFYIFLGLIIYFTYGIQQSNENKPMSSYSGVVSYGGNDEKEKSSKDAEEKHEILATSEDETNAEVNEEVKEE